LYPKVICDPIHNQIYIDRQKEKVILDLIECREVQRLRRIRQLGVSYYTYPGAEHCRFSHALGTFHFMKIALNNAKEYENIPLDKKEYLASLAAALLHDIGHGPLSHLLENKFSSKHEKWTEEIIASHETEVNSVLRNLDSELPELVIKILFHPSEDLSWINALLSSQIDVDRMDYLLRDSHYCGVKYGHFDYNWIFHTIRIRKIPPYDLLQPVWIEKALRAIEEYIFARYNMYWTVYYHKTTRGYEELLNAIIERAYCLLKEDHSLNFISEAVKKFILGDQLSVSEYLSIDDSIIFSQLILWQNADDSILKDLCLRFLNRKGFKPVDYREKKIRSHKDRDQAHKKINNLLKNKGLDPKYYFLESISASKAYDYYHPERGEDERTAKNSIFIFDKAEKLNEISSLPDMGRLRIITGQEQIKKYYYVPDEIRDSANKILDKLKE